MYIHIPKRKYRISIDRKKSFQQHRTLNSFIHKCTPCPNTDFSHSQINNTRRLKKTPVPRIMSFSFSLTLAIIISSSPKLSWLYPRWGHQRTRASRYYVVLVHIIISTSPLSFSLPTPSV